MLHQRKKSEARFRSLRRPPPSLVSSDRARVSWRSSENLLAPRRPRKLSRERRAQLEGCRRIIWTSMMRTDLLLGYHQVEQGLQELRVLVILDSESVLVQEYGNDFSIKSILYWVRWHRQKNLSAWSRFLTHFVFWQEDSMKPEVHVCSLSRTYP